VEPVRDLSLLGFEVSPTRFWFGFVCRPLIRLRFNNEKFDAAFRYALVRLLDATESVSNCSATDGGGSAPSMAPRSGSAHRCRSRMKRLWRNRN
jgi:hypothetical protein